MAEPKLEIEQRIERIEEAVLTMASWLVQAQTGFGQKDYEGIAKIINGPNRGTRTTEATPEAGTESTEPREDSVGEGGLR